MQCMTASDAVEVMEWVSAEVPMARSNGNAMKSQLPCTWKGSHRFLALLPGWKCIGACAILRGQRNLCLAGPFRAGAEANSTQQGASSSFLS